MPSSVHRLLSSEYGGPTARAGFLYQDHVAVQFCVEMISGRGLQAVWCELLDDITLIWEHALGDHAEFVQVKATRRPRMWTVAAIVGRAAGRVGTSMVEKSIANDRCAEPNSFRLVTAADVAPELRPLTNPLSSADRAAPSAAFAALQEAIAVALPDVVSENGSDVRTWARRALWEVRGGQAAVEASVFVLLSRFLHDTYGIASPDRVEAIRELLLASVFNAAVADARIALDSKKLRLADVSASVLSRIQSLRSPAPATGGTRLRHELLGIGIPEDDVDGIMESFVRGSAALRTDTYLEVSRRERTDDSIDVLLRSLRLRRISGEIPVGPLAFHNLCVEELRRFGETLPANERPSITYLTNRMYERVTRGLHRFKEGDE